MSQASVSKVYCLLLLERVSTGGEMNISLNVSRVPSSYQVRGPRSLACDMRSRFESGDMILRKLIRNHLNILPSPRNNFNLLTVLGTCQFKMATAV